MYENSLTHLGQPVLYPVCQGQFRRARVQRSGAPEADEDA